MGDSDFLQGPEALLRIFPAGAAEGTQAAGSAHEDDVEHTVIEHRVAGLGDVGDVPCRLPDRKTPGIHAVHQNLAGIAGQKAQDTAKQGAFAHAVGA